MESASFSVIKKRRLWARIVVTLGFAATLAGCSSRTTAPSSFQPNLARGTVEVASLDARELPHISMNASGIIAFAADDPGGRRVYLFTGGGSKQISSGTACYAPRINAGGQVVWTQRDPGSAGQTYLYDGVAAARISSGTGLHVFPVINSKGDVAWSGYDAGDDFDVWRRDAATGKVTNLSNSDGIPQLLQSFSDSGHLAYQQYQQSDNTMEFRRMRMGAGAVATPELVASNVAFDDNLFELGFPLPSRQVNAKGNAVAPSQGKVLLYDGASARVITTGALISECKHPEINALSQVVFQGYDGMTTQIYLFDPASGVIQQISHGTTNNRYPHLSDSGFVVYQGKQGRFNQVFRYAGGSVQQISLNPFDNIFPQVDEQGDTSWIAREQGPDGWHYRKILLARAAQGSSVPISTLQLPAKAQSALARQSAVQAGAAFFSPPPNLAPDPKTTSFSFIAFGDSRGTDISWLVGDQSNWSFDKLMFGAVNQAFRPDFYMFLGDAATHHFYFGNRLQQWLQLKSSLTSKPLFFAKGNHELYDVFFSETDYADDAKADTLSLLSPGNAFNVTTTPNFTDPTYTYLNYSFLWGNTHLACLDSFAFAPGIKNYGDVTDEQLGWASAADAYGPTAKAQNTIFFTHAPLIPLEAEDTVNMGQLAQSFQNCDLFLGAHEHLYSRMLLQGSVQTALANPLQFPYPLVQITTGGAAAGMDNNSAINQPRPSGEVDNFEPHFLWVVVQGDTIWVQSIVVQNDDTTWATKPLDAVKKQGTGMSWHTYTLNPSDAPAIPSPPSP